MKHTASIAALPIALLTSLLFSLSLPAFAATSTVSLTVGGSSGPIAATTGSPVVFDVTVDCGTASDDDLVVVTGSVQPKDGDPDSEIAWDIRNDSGSTIRINKFGVSWNCLVDPGSVCSDWKFAHMRFDVPDENKIYEDMSPVDNSNSFPLMTFDTNVADTSPYTNPYIDIAAGETVPINEMEFVWWDPTAEGGAGDWEKYENIQTGTSVEFTVTWGDVSGNTYTQIFTLTW